MEVDIGKRFFDKLEGMGKACLDSSIFIYHLEDIYPYSILTYRLMKMIAAGEIRSIMSVLTVAELFAKPYKLRDEKRILLFEEFIQSLPNNYIQDVDYEIAKKGALLRAEYNLRTPDAILLATALIGHSDCFISNDLNLKKTDIKGVSILILEEFFED